MRELTRALRYKRGMLDLFYRFSLESVKFNNQVLACMMVIWLVVIGCAVSSILRQPFRPKQRWIWIGVVTLFPVLGVLCYLPFSLKSEDSPEFLIWRRVRPKR